MSRFKGLKFLGRANLYPSDQKSLTAALNNQNKHMRLDYDMDNFSGSWTRGNRYNIMLNGSVYYRDVPESVVDKLARELEQEYEPIYGSGCVHVIEL